MFQQQHQNKKFDVWDNPNISEDKDFREIDEENFKIKDKQTVRELKNMIYKSENVVSDVVRGNEQFSQKTHNVFDAIDSFKKEQPASVTNQWLYYNLEDVDIDDAKTTKSAYDFLDELKRRNEPQQVPVSMETEFKPTFSSKPTKMKTEHENRGKATIETNKLSFGDDL